MALSLSELINSSVFDQMTEVAKKSEKMERTLDVKIVEMSEHAYKRSKERFNLEREASLRHFRELLKTATLVSEVSCDESGERTLLYGVRDSGHAVCVHLSLDYLNIVTVYKTRNIHTAEIMRDKVQSFYQSELRKFQRKERALLKKKPFIDIDSHAKIYASKLAIMKTSSKKKIAEEQNNIAKCEEIISANEKLVYEVTSSVRQLAKAIIGMMP